MFKYFKLFVCRCLIYQERIFYTGDTTPGVSNPQHPINRWHGFNKDVPFVGIMLLNFILQRVEQKT